MTRVYMDWEFLEDGKTIPMWTNDLRQEVHRWLHIEQMDTGAWWMNLCGLVINVRVDRDGNPKDVLIEGPEEPKPGVRYRFEVNETGDEATNGAQ